MEEVVNVSEGTVGAVFICNSSKGTELEVMTKDYRCKSTLCVGDMVYVEVHTTDSFSVRHKPTPEKTESVSSSFTIEVKGRVVHMPFAQGIGSASTLVVTMHKGTTRINAGTIVTIPKEIPTDYIYEELLPGDKVYVTVGWVW